MSRMGNKLIDVHSSVKVEIAGGQVKVTGPKGALDFALPEEISIEQNGNQLSVKRESEDRFVKMKHGMVRSIVNSMVVGVVGGFKKELELSGVGYRAQLSGKTLTISLGYSNPVVYTVPEGVNVVMPDQTHITLESIDKQKVGEVAAQIRRFRKPDAYHGKGVRFVGEQLSLKEGKTVK